MVHGWRRGALLAVGLAVGLTFGYAVTPVALAAFTDRTGNPASTFTAAGTFPTYPQAVLADGPVAYYRSDDAAGSATAADSSGAGNTGVYVSPTTGFQAPGGPASAGGTALRLPAAGAATVSANVALSSPDTFTTEVWFTTVTHAGQRLVQFADSASGNVTATDRTVSLSNTGQLLFVVAGTTISSAAGYADGAWHLVTSSLGAAGMKLYVDGALVASNAGVTAGMGIPTGYWRMGGQVGQWFSGTLDEAAVFGTQLTDAQIATHWSVGSTAATPAQYTAAITADSPWALLHLDDPPLSTYPRGSGDFPTPAADAGGQGNVATIRGVLPRGMVGGGPGALVGAGAAGTSVRFLGAGLGYDPVTYTNPAAWSEELWFRTSTPYGGGLFLFTSSTTGYPSSYDRMAFMTDDGHITYGVYANGVRYVTSPAAYNDGAWHHLVGTGGPAGLALYVDGRRVAADPSVTSGENTAGHFRWGGGANTANWGTRPSSEYLDGDIDEVAFYLTQLGAQQVAWHYHANH